MRDMRFIFGCLLFLFIQFDLQAQSTLTIRTAWQGKPISLPFRTRIQDSVPLEIDALKFYIHYSHKGQTIHQLVDFESSDKVAVPIQFEGDSLKLFIGTAKGLDAKGVRSGPLDPSLGMYWTWLTGYIQAKVEGSSTKLKTQQHRFEYHLGYRQDQPYDLPSVTIKKTGNDPLLLLELSDWFAVNPLIDRPKVVDPGPEATILLRRLGQSFRQQF